MKLYCWFLIAFLALPVELLAEEPIRPIMPPSNPDMAKILLGKRLFDEKLLSGDHSRACRDCHFIEQGGADRLPRPLGLDGKPMTLNSPTVFNLKFNFHVGIIGSFESLVDQVLKSVQNSRAMGGNWDDIVQKLKADDSYKAAFDGIYQGIISKENIADAIVVYEEAMITPSRFDDYLLGDENAITEEEKKGYTLFKKYGCSACHQGQNVGGNMFQVFGAVESYFGDEVELEAIDRGRFNITQEARDMHVFRVPSLRNVAETPPYFHNGSTYSLSEAIDIMARYQLGRKIPPEDKAAIIAFLGSLSGELVLGLGQ